MPDAAEQVQKLKAKLGATTDTVTSFVAISKDGKTVAHGSTELKALRLLEKTLKKK